MRQAEFPAASQPVAISIHAPQWGATREECGEVVQVDISIHAPQWGATLGVMAVGDGSLISIHAPQWGATRIRLRMPTCTRFQSTHPSGVRPDTGHVPSASRYFNPRTPVGCDFRSAAVHGELELISIHAPQWGATIAPIPTESSACHFNPRTPVGCDVSGHKQRYRA